MKYFECNSLKLTADKAELIVLGFTGSKDLSIRVDGQNIMEKQKENLLVLKLIRNSLLSYR